MTITPPTTIAREPLLVLADIIQEELGLTDVTVKGIVYSRVLIYNQRYQIPPFDGIYVVLSHLGGKTISNNNYQYDAGLGAGMNEVQQSVIAEDVQIDVMSVNDEARQRKEEIIMALNSVYARSQSDTYAFFIARMPDGFKDVSFIEETSRMNRYSTTARIHSLYTKTKDTSYYDTFEDAELHYS